jgi:hypothetical protein
MAVEAKPEKDFLDIFGESCLIEATGTKSADLQKGLFRQLLETLWLPKDLSDEEIDARWHAGIATLIAIRPQDALEGNLALQMVATHNAALECLKLGILAGQTPYGFDYIKQAEKLMSLSLRQLEALDKHRGVGVTRVNVENVNVQAGGQAVVGHVQTERMLDRPDVEVCPPERAIEHKPIETLDLMPAAPAHAPARKGRNGSS